MWAADGMATALCEISGNGRPNPGKEDHIGLGEMTSCLPKELGVDQNDLGPFDGRSGRHWPWWPAINHSK